MFFFGSKIRKITSFAFRPSDASMKHSRSSLHDSLAELEDDRRRTYLVKYGESEGFSTDGPNDDQKNFSTAV